MHNLGQGSELRGQAWAGQRAARCPWRRHWNVGGQAREHQGGGRAGDAGQGRGLGGHGEKAGLDLKGGGSLNRKYRAWRDADKG